MNSLNVIFEGYNRIAFWEIVLAKFKNLIFSWKLVGDPWSEGRSPDGEPGGEAESRRRCPQAVDWTTREHSHLRRHQTLPQIPRIAIFQKAQAL